MNNQEIREVLMANAIKVVANRGLENATVRTISEAANTNISYIYRYFIDKDDLLNRTFLRENEAFVNYLVNFMNENVGTENDLVTRLTNLTNIAFTYLSTNADKCKFMRYFFNSPNVTKIAKEIDGLAAIMEDATDKYLPELVDKESFVIIFLDEVFSLAMRYVNRQMDMDRIRQARDFLIQPTKK